MTIILYIPDHELREALQPIVVICSTMPTFQ